MDTREQSITMATAGNHCSRTRLWRRLGRYNGGYRGYRCRPVTARAGKSLEAFLVSTPVLWHGLGERAELGAVIEEDEGGETDRYPCGFQWKRGIAVPPLTQQGLGSLLQSQAHLRRVHSGSTMGTGGLGA
jgi:hypothetical protein